MTPEQRSALALAGIEPTYAGAADLLASCAIIDGRLVPFTTPTVSDDDLRIVHQSLTAACVISARRDAARGCP